MSSKFSIDINCDVGEGIGNESLLMPYVSSCNIACAAHAGSIEIIDKVISLAQKHNVKIGAHPSFPDRKNFGRKIMKISNQDLQKSIENQINLLVKRVKLQGATLHHIKPHGALYNLITKDKEIAQVVVNAIQNTVSNVFLYVPFNSVIANIALHNKIKVKFETFADRNYNDNLTLVSRTQKNALILDKDQVIKHITNMIVHKKIKTLSGEKSIKVDTICVHGDTENAVELVAYIHKKFTANNIAIV